MARRNLHGGAVRLCELIDDVPSPQNFNLIRKAFIKEFLANS